MDFISETNLCGRKLLKIVSNGNAIIAELLRLSQHIPDVFTHDPASSPMAQQEQARYKDIIFDFSYLKKNNFYENKIQASSELLDLDEEFRESHILILERFYLLFESIYKYVREYVKFLEDLDNGVIYIQQTFDSILVNQDGKQLLAEALYLYGAMLIILDMKIPGIVRERMLISYYRYKGAGEIRNIDEVCKLCRNTGFIPGQKKVPQNYPVDYFSRMPIPDTVISMIVGRLRSDDIYLQTSYYPLPEHRSTALANQAGMLYIILYFKPSILLKEKAVMREIVDKHFPDNWVISYYMGFTVDLSIVWGPFAAAAAAVSNSTQPNQVKELSVLHTQNLTKLLKELDHFLTEGVLTEEYVLDNISKLLNCLRNCNVTLRWLILHRTAENKKLRDVILQETDAEHILLLLLNTAQFEFVLKKLFSELLEQKEKKWQDCKNVAKERMNELAEYFSGEKALVKIKDEQLQKWFIDIASKIDELSYHDATLAGRRIQQLNSALEEVEEFHQINSSLQVKQFLGDTRDLLKKMIRYVNIKESVLVTVATISDISYAWEIINDYVDSMQSRIKKDPALIIKIRSTFLKLASMLELPLVRISQAKSNDIVSVSQYYSAELVAFVRKVLEIIPISMFNVLNRIISIQTNKLKQLPTKFPRDQLKDYAQLPSRYDLAKATYEVSKFTEGILAMEKTLMGIVEVDPKQLLEDGIRKELVRQIAVALDSTLIFKTGKIQDYETQLKVLRDKLQGMLRSFEYIQDYVNVYGLKIWQEEFSRIINYNVEQERNRFLKRKIYDWQSEYQSSVIPIPKFRPVDEYTSNFMGRVVRELLVQTDPKKTMYVDQMSGWFDLSGNEIIGITTFSLLNQSIGVPGMTGVDNLLSFIITKLLQTFVRTYKNEILNADVTRKLIQEFERNVSPPSSLKQDLPAQYPFILSKLSKVWYFVLEIVVKVGRAQLIRRHIASELNFSCKLDSNPLASALSVMNNAVMNDIQHHKRYPQDIPYPDDDNQLLEELSKYLETAGMSSPYEKVYITTEPLPHIGLMLFLFVIAHISKFQYDEALDCLVCKKKDDLLDGVPFEVGIATTLRQFHPTEQDLFLVYLGQFIRANIAGINEKSKNAEIPNEVILVLRFLQIFCKFSGLSIKDIENYVPSYLFARFGMTAPPPVVPKKRGFFF